MTARGDAPTAVARLSAREVQVLRLASKGWTNGEIARLLGLSIHAVKFHLASIYRKLGVANRTEAAVAFLNSTTGSLASPREESS
jgi:DNA-binding NarL/FixJ family response regulator